MDRNFGFNYKSCLIALSLFSIVGISSTLNAQDNDSTIAPVQNPEQVFKTPDYQGDFLERSTLVGDLGGARQKLANDGITIDADLTQTSMGVVSGGLDNGWEYSGRGQTTLNMDTAKMGFWPGGLLTISGEGNFGKAMIGKTGALASVNANDLFPELDNSYVMTQLSYTQFLSKEFGIAFGKFATITDTSGDMNEFAHGKGSKQFLNSAFNFNPIIGLTVPYSTFGVTALYMPVNELVVSLGVLDSKSTPSDGFGNLYDKGATLVSEARYTTDFFDMTGHQLIGGTFSTRDYASLDQSAANFIIPGLPVQQANDSWAAYWNADQYFYQPVKGENKGAGVFARYGVSDGDANPIQNFLSAGIGSKGIIPCRENDSFGLGYFYSWTADNQITKVTGFEDSQGLEAYYDFAITPALHLTPDLQWVQPSQKRVDSSWVTGFRLYTIF